MGKTLGIKDVSFWENWIPWIIGGIICIIIFPWDKVKELIVPTPKEIIKYIKVPEYIYIEKPILVSAESGEKEKTPEVKIEPKEDIICVFDIDNTLTIGKVERCIKMCKDMGCRLAINATTDVETPDDLPLKKWGFVDPYFDPNDYYSDPNSKTTNFNEAASTKLENMISLQNKYNIKDRRRLILVDDNRINIDKITESGFGGVHVGKKNPGIQEEDIVELYNIITELNPKDS